jgi:hypothetical protein
MLLIAESATTLPLSTGVLAEYLNEKVRRSLTKKGVNCTCSRHIPHISHCTYILRFPLCLWPVKHIEIKMPALSDSVHDDGNVAATSPDFSPSERTDSGYDSLVPTGPGHTSSFCRLRGVVELVKWGKEQVFDDVPSAMTLTFNCLSTERPTHLHIDHIAFRHPSTGAPTTLRGALRPNFNPVLSRNSFARIQWTGAIYGPHSTSASLASCFTRTFEHRMSLMLSSDDRTGPPVQDARFQAEVEIVHHITAEPLEGRPFHNGDTAAIGYNDYIESMWADAFGDGAWLGRTEIRDAIWALKDGKLRLSLVSLPDTGRIWGDDGSVVEADVFEEVFLDIHRLEMVTK